MRLALVISQLGAGGAERVLSTMANHWAARGHEVTLVTFARKESDFYPLDAAVRRAALGLADSSANLRQSLRNGWLRIRALRKALLDSHPDVVISFMDTTNTQTLLATRNLSVPVVISERTDPAQHRIGAMRSWARRVTYPWADAIVVPSRGVARWSQGNIRGPRLRVIPNPARYERRSPPSDKPSRERLVVTLGRLSAEKQLDYLLRAFDRCGSRHPEWSLQIIGEGPDRHRLEALAADLGIGQRVRFPGVVQDPETVLCNADLFVLTSRYEGFPNALVEAMACGLAVLCFDCPSGPSEIIRQGVDGVLVPAQDLDALADAMDRLMSDETERRRLGSSAFEVAERFDVERIMSMWEDVIEEVRA
jgi:glycosyltransferase involved in cell wall biosynthesis